MTEPTRRVYVSRPLSQFASSEMNPDETISFESGGTRIDVRFDGNGGLRVSSSYSRLVMLPEASNVVIVRCENDAAIAIVRRIRQEVGLNGDPLLVVTRDDVRTLIEAALR